MKINNAIFLNYLLCPYKAGLSLDHQSAPLTTYQALAEDTARRYELLAREAISRLSQDVVLSPDRAKLASDLQQGPSLILDATIEALDASLFVRVRCLPVGSTDASGCRACSPSRASHRPFCRKLGSCHFEVKLQK